MSTNSTRRQQIAMSLQDKEYRDAFVSEHIDNAVAFQVRAMREARQWSQKDLGRRAGMAQERVSVLEDPDYGRMSLSTLKRLASALDVALVVRFAPFSELVDWSVNVSPEHLAVPDFKHDPGFQEGPAHFPDAATGDLIPSPEHTEVKAGFMRSVGTALRNVWQPEAFIASPYEDGARTHPDFVPATATS